MIQEKISWVDYYLGLAFMIAEKSTDPNTHHGCIIVKDNRPLGFGYNGLPRKAKDDDYLIKEKSSRPVKYLWYYHSEENALANCVIRPDGATAYVTGQCCNHCLYSLWQNGIIEVYMVDGHGTQLFSQECLDWEKEFIEQTGIIVHKVKPNLSWLVNSIDERILNLCPTIKSPNSLLGKID